ncbi:hypothetical protein D3C78_1647170 [compost metagenome]
MRGDLLETLLTLDEVPASLATFLVALDHRQLFGHVEGDVVVLRATITTTAFGCSILSDQNKVLLLRESVLCDTPGDPILEVGVHLKETMEFASIDQLG